MRVLEGVGTLVQLGGLMARLCKVVRLSHHLTPPVAPKLNII